MNILVTGGVGNVGRAAVQLLAARGHVIRVIGRRQGLTVPGAEYRSCDITDIAALEAQIEGMEAVVHLAALPGPSMGAPETVFRINCQGHLQCVPSRRGRGHQAGGQRELYKRP